MKAPMESYVRSAVNLAQSFARNRIDADFAAQEKEIVYIFDSNIFVFEADLFDTRRLTEDIDNLVGKTDLEIARVMERLTARYLFSGALPGQKEGRAYITLPHFEEALDVARVIASKLDGRRPKHRAPLDRGEIRDSVIAIIEGHASTEQKLRRLGEVLPKAWLETLDAKAHFRRVLKESFVDPNRLVPLDKADWAAGASAPSPIDVQPWFNVLPEPSPQKDDDHIRADGLSLATIVNLYRQDEYSRGRNRERKYVLVTSDRSITNAVRRRLNVLNASGIPFFIRTPADFLPLLNLNSMSTALSGVRSGERLEAVFRNIFEALSAAVEWIALTSKEGASTPKLMLDYDPLKQLQQSWFDISQFTAALNLPYAYDIPWMFDDIRAYLTTTAKLEAASLVETSVQQVADQHLMIVISATLNQLRKLNQEKQSGHRRLHVQVLGDIFASIAPAGDIDTVLAESTEQGALPPAVHEALTKNADRAESQLLAACLFIAADRWTLASQAAARGLEQIEAGRHPLSHRLDARYLVAHCLRFSMRGMSELQRAEHLLNLNLQSYSAREDVNELAWRRRLRDEMEYGSLLITAAILSALSCTIVGRHLLGDEARYFFSELSPHDYLGQGVKRLRAALAELDEAQPADKHNVDDQGGQFTSALRQMATTNLVEAFLFEQIGPGLQSDQPLFGDDAECLVSALGDIIHASHNSSSLILTHHIYYWRARCLLAKTGDERNDALKKLRTHLGKVKASKSLPLIDSLEFEFIGRQLRLDHQSEGDSQS